MDLRASIEQMEPVRSGPPVELQKKIVTVRQLLEHLPMVDKSLFMRTRMSSMQFTLCRIHPNEVAVVENRDMFASTEKSEAPIVVDINKYRIGSTPRGYVPPVIVIEGSVRHSRARIQGEKILAWIGAEALKVMKQVEFVETQPVVREQIFKEKKTQLHFQMEATGTGPAGLGSTSLQQGSNTTPGQETIRAKGMCKACAGMKANHTCDKEMKAASKMYATAVKAGYRSPKGIMGVAPPGREDQVLKLKEKYGEDSPIPFKIAWHQHGVEKKKKEMDAMSKRDMDSMPYGGDGSLQSPGSGNGPRMASQAKARIQAGGPGSGRRPEGGGLAKQRSDRHWKAMNYHERMRDRAEDKGNMRLANLHDRALEAHNDAAFANITGKGYNQAAARADKLSQKARSFSDDSMAAEMPAGGADGKKNKKVRVEITNDDMAMGGPGSGRHPEGSKDMHDHLIKNGWRQTASFRERGHEKDENPAYARYDHNSKRGSVYLHPNNSWEHSIKIGKRGSKTGGGEGTKQFDRRMSRYDDSMAAEMPNAVMPRAGTSSLSSPGSGSGPSIRPTNASMRPTGMMRSERGIVKKIVTKKKE